MAEITLGIPVYNSSPFLDELFACLRRLDPLPSEIVFLDDASTDGSFTRLGEFSCSTDTQIPVRVLRNEHNLGIAGSYNRLAREARSEWVQILDADDLLVEADFYQRVATSLDSEDDIVVTALTSNARLLDWVARICSRLVPRRPPRWLPLLGSVATRSGVLYRRSRLIEHPFPDPAYPGSDVIHLLELRLRYVCVFQSDIHVRYRVHAHAQSSRARDYTAYRQELEQFGSMTQLAHRLDLWLREIGQRLAR